MYDEEKSIDKILEGRSSIDKALEEYTKHKNDKETVPGNNKPENKPTPDNKPDNNSSNNIPEFSGPAASNGQDAPINNVPEFTGGVNDTTPPTVPDKPEGEIPKPTKPETSNGDSLVQPEIPEFKGGVNAVEAAVNEIPTFGAKQPEIKKILDELVNIKDQIKDGEENGAEDYYINGLKDRLADLEKAFDLLTQNLSAVNKVPEYTGPVTSESQPHLEGTAPDSGQGGTAGEIVDPNQNLGSVGGASATQNADFGQTPAVTQLSEKPEEAKPAKAKSKELASTGMNSSSTTALGLSLIGLIGLAVRRKLSK